MMTVNEIMTTQVYTVRSNTTLTEAAALFLTHKFGCLSVIDGDDQLEGILTVAD
jgi:CBS domain-containing membrane protein